VPDIPLVIQRINSRSMTAKVAPAWPRNRASDEVGGRSGGPAADGLSPDRPKLDSAPGSAVVYNHRTS
jgi:hypothetical protein